MSVTVVLTRLIKSQVRILRAKDTATFLSKPTTRKNDNQQREIPLPQAYPADMDGRMRSDYFFSCAVKKHNQIFENT